ncbi:MAG: hypothetical protein WA120_05735 [Candidatus Hydromicrobium sp.]
MKVKKIYVITLIICFLLISVATSSCFNSGNIKESGTTQDIKNSEEVSSGSEDISEEEFNDLLENEDFVDVLGSFCRYPGSEFKEAKQVEDDENLFYILLEVMEDSKKVEEYYKNKKVQSIWRRSAIFEESSEKVEEEFLESESENIPISKFTYSNEEKDKVVNVLIKGLEENRTQIMIIYWNLQ